MEVSDERRIPFLLSLNYQNQIHVFTLRYMGLVWPEIYSDFNDLNVREVGLLYGRGTGSRNWHGSISAGPSLAILEVRERDDEFLEPSFETDHKLGIALGTQIFWRLNNSFGVGLYGFGNINSVEHLLGATINVQLLFK